MKKEYIVELTEEEADELMAEHWVGEVIRCKDCKHYMTIHCTCDGCCISDDWFCADGVRK